MKIGIFDPYLDDGGGGEKYMMTIAEFFSKDHDVSVFWDDKRDLELVGNRFALDLRRVSLVENIFKKGLVEKLKKTSSFDVIIFHSDGSIPVSFSKKLFIHIQRPIEGFKKDIRSKIKLSRVNQVFVNSEFTKKYIDNSSGLDTTVIYPPVDLKPKDIKRENIILHVGRFRVRKKTVNNVSDFKKQNMLVDAFIEMEKSISDWKLVLAVSLQEDDKEAFNQLKSKAKGHRIEFIINQNNEKIWELYSKAKIYWHASGYGEDLEKHPELAEHFGISTVEAMGGGCVPVVINAGGQKEIVADKKDGFLWNTKDEFKQKTLLLIKDEKLLLRMSIESKKSAKKFSKQAFCKKIENLVQ